MLIREVDHDNFKSSAGCLLTALKLGIFLCMRCAAIHRKLGTHISKVKSMSMDSWSNDQVEVSRLQKCPARGHANRLQNMKKVGNITSNRIYNPQNTRPPVTFDTDEADSAMERFIRQKYQERKLQGQNGQRAARQNTGSTESDDNPPPLPPKTGSRFGFRSASNIFPMSSKAKKESARQEFENRRSQDRSPSPPRRTNKQSKVFGMSVGPLEMAKPDLESKMIQLRDMGFGDEARCRTVLKSMNGNLEKTVETLVRLGENTGGSGPVSRSRSPISPGPSSGLTVGISREWERRPSEKASNNPWDIAPAPQPQSAQSTGAAYQANGGNPYQQTPASTNPFELSTSRSQLDLNASFQAMSVSQPQQLFPNHTGGFSNQQPQMQQPPPVPSIPQQFNSNAFYSNNNSGMQYQQPMQAQAQQPQQNYNPFMSQQPQQMQQQPQQVQQNQPLNPMTNGISSSNPFGPQFSGSQQQFQPFDNQPFNNQQNQPQQAYYGGQQQPQAQQSQMGQSNPWATQQSQQQQQPQQPQPQTQQMQYQGAPQYQQQPQQMQQSQQQQYQQFAQQPQQPFQQQPQPLISQPTGRVDKNSIMALYNMPPPQQQQQPQQVPSNPMASEASLFALPQRSATMPMESSFGSSAAGTRNPFLGAGGAPANTNSSPFASPAPGQQPGSNFGGVNAGGRHVSQESISIGAGDWHNGRHSPDAFANLSQYMR